MTFICLQVLTLVVFQTPVKTVAVVTQMVLVVTGVLVLEITMAETVKYTMSLVGTLLTDMLQ